MGSDPFFMQQIAYVCCVHNIQIQTVFEILSLLSKIDGRDRFCLNKLYKNNLRGKEEMNEQYGKHC